ncbi:hypothetical protein [Nodularia sp. UHCC 0506]|uniref:hypothetical protein n=1 Tax=Nodularia sp. UHCC 0506 TaxID=3110243 RepID=UPI002B21983F|nr:hypothetical protein [Nodularia sp. UHCC 0506]MEA5513111.1 hypothetical protein [Nodularia sp. UHCC 0506]
MLKNVYLTPWPYFYLRETKPDTQLKKATVFSELWLFTTKVGKNGNKPDIHFKKSTYEQYQQLS